MARTSENTFESCREFLKKRFPKKRFSTIYDRNKYTGIDNIAIYMSKDRVIKFTCKKKEANACKRLMNKRLKNVVKIHNVYSLYWPAEWAPSSNKFGYEQIYAIEMEKLYYKERFAQSDLLIEDIIYKFSINKGCELLSDIVNGYKELMRYGIFYRDLHSRNIMFDKNGVLKFIDFGIIDLKSIKNSVDK